MHILRIATVYDPKADALPSEFRDTLTEQDIEAIRTGPKYFAGIAGSDSPRWLRDILAAFSKTIYELQFYSSGGSQYRPYFRFYWQGQPALSLPRRKPLRSDMPGFLRHIYSIIGAFRENGFDSAGGLHPGDELIPISETGIGIEEDSPIRPDEVIPFLGTFDGRELCYLPDGSGAWAESCTFSRVQDLQAETAGYFEALLKGTRI
jgi:hypothetical protein